MLENKKILIISPQNWGKMMVAKHHYAVQLAKLGNRIYYLNPPDEKLKVKFQIQDSDIPGLKIVTYRPFFPTLLRFKLRGLFDSLMKIQVKSLLRKLGVAFDMVWSFEPNLYCDLRIFGAPLKIYHPVDELFYDYQIKVGESADLILSVTQEILSKFEHLPVPKHHINHGLSDAFAGFARQKDFQQPYIVPDQIKVGYVGNLLRPDIDHPILIKIIQDHPTLQFIFWGAYDTAHSNFGGTLTPAITQFIKALQLSENVILRGPLAQADLAQEMQDTEAFLICYDIEKDQSKGTNYHKVIELLSTGKVVVSNNITAYADKQDLLVMGQSRVNNEELPEIFRKVIDNLNTYNAPHIQKQRKSFCLLNTYSYHLKTINNLI